MATRSGEIDDFDSIDEAISLVQTSVPLSLGEAADLLPQLRQLRDNGVPREAMTIVDSGGRPAIVVSLRVATTRDAVARLALSRVQIPDGIESL